MDEDIINTVSQMLGAGVQIVDCEQQQTVHEEEVLLVNGVPLSLNCADGEAIRQALLAGEVPACDLLNRLLMRAGVGVIRPPHQPHHQQPVAIESSFRVTSSVTTTEAITIARDGRLLDERLAQTTEDNVYVAECREYWQPPSTNANQQTKNDGNQQTTAESVVEPKPPPLPRRPLYSFEGSGTSSARSLSSNIFSSSGGGGCLDNVNSDSYDSGHVPGSSPLLRSSAMSSTSLDSRSSHATAATSCCEVDDDIDVDQTDYSASVKMNKPRYFSSWPQWVGFVV